MFQQSTKVMSGGKTKQVHELTVISGFYARPFQPCFKAHLADNFADEAAVAFEITKWLIAPSTEKKRKLHPNEGFEVRAALFKFCVCVQ